MGCFGYFSKDQRELRMRSKKTGLDELGITWDGSVMRGELSVQEAHRRAEQQAQLNRGERGRAQSGCEPLDAGTK